VSVPTPDIGAVYNGGTVIVVQDDFVVDHSDAGPPQPEHPHGLTTITTVANGWGCLKVEGDIFAIDIPSLAAAANHAFLKHPVRLVVDLTGVAVCVEEGIEWLREISQRVGRGNGELVVAVASGTSLRQILEKEGIATLDADQLTRFLSHDPTAHG
jgi:hypothetical protein